MPTDTNAEADDVAAGPRSLRWEEWITTPRFVGGTVLAVLGVLVAGIASLGSGGTAPTQSNRVLFVGIVAVVLGVVVALSGYRLTARQRQYLDQAERERAEIRDYLALLEEVAVAEPESSWEVRSRLERAVGNLETAREAVYRRDYANFLSLYYEASRQEILLYGLLDSRADGWTFGLDVDLGPGTDEVAASSRLRNLGRRIRSYAEESLPEQRWELVESYLGEADDRPPSPLDLYYAVRVLHEWNVSRYERATQVRRFLRGGILVVVVVLAGLAAVLGLGFTGGDGGQGFLEAVNATSTVVASVQDGSVLLNDAFLGLVVLTGALGALFSMVYRSFGEFYSLTTDPSIPQPVFMLEALLARTLFGGVSALFLFLVARTEFAGVVFAGDLLKNPLALLVLSFVAGFSEQLVDETAGRIAENVTAPEEASEGDPSSGPTRDEGASTGTGSGAPAGGPATGPDRENVSTVRDDRTEGGDHDRTEGGDHDRAGGSDHDRGGGSSGSGVPDERTGAAAEGDRDEPTTGGGDGRDEDDGPSDDAGGGRGDGNEDGGGDGDGNGDGDGDGEPSRSGGSS
jgi:hypothetical protein